jgi:rRNA maturation RNase YbeY
MSGLDRDILSPGDGQSAQAALPPASIDILDAAGLLPASALANLRREVAAALAHIPRPGEVRVRLVNDAEMADAHLKYSDIPGTTDVLTFDLSEGRTASGDPLDVDILVCVDEARRHAVLRNHAAEREVLLYILHGVLHCLDHDDHDDAAYERMHAEEDRILRAIGIGPIFGSGSGTPPLRGGSEPGACSHSIAAPPRKALARAVELLSQPLTVRPCGFASRDPYPDGERGLSVDAIVHRRNLPHIRMLGATYFVTWHSRPDVDFSPAEQTSVLEALCHFDGSRCMVYAANVMSNHIHWIVRPFQECSLDDLVTSVKRFSSGAINKLRGIKGHVWDAECFDHIIRDPDYFRKFLAYVIQNPVSANVVRNAALYEWTFVSPAAIGEPISNRASSEPATEWRGTQTEDPS